jgi:hypothetical protein
MCNEFAKHFEQIANIPNDAPDDPDIVKRVSDFRTQCCDGEIRHIETDELSKPLKGLSYNKACGIDGVNRLPFVFNMTALLLRDRLQFIKDQAVF